MYFSLRSLTRHQARSLPLRSSRRTGLRLRQFHASSYEYAVKPFMLADIGEGIKECEVIQWFVEPGASIEEFDPICEVQSDKASVEITSRYSGVIKHLHYNVGDMALVGKPLVDIDMPDAEGGAEPEVAVPPPTPSAPASEAAQSPVASSTSTPIPEPAAASRYKSLATPAVRRICKEHNIDITQVSGTGKDSRVMKEDVLRFLSQKQQPPQSQSPLASNITSPEMSSSTSPLTPIQKQMFKTMTGSLNIPHFLYTDEIEVDKVAAVRADMNQELASSGEKLKLSFMPFFIKALSMSLTKFPILNARVSFDDNGVPHIVNRPIHNIGVAMDTPSGLIVPNIKDVANKSIVEIGRDLVRLQELGAANKLGAQDLKDGTITLSNIGTVGGTYVAPVIVDSQVAIGGIGKARVLPRFDANMQVVPRRVVNASWSGDHRIIDGVTMAKMVQSWKTYVEHPERMLMNMK